MASQTSKEEKEIQKRLRNILQMKKPYLLVVEDAVKKRPDGIVDIKLRVYRGKVTDVVVSDSIRYTFK